MFGKVLTSKLYGFQFRRVVETKESSLTPNEILVTKAAITTTGNCTLVVVPSGDKITDSATFGYLKGRGFS